MGEILFHETVDQFETVVDLERTLLRQTITRLEHDYEVACTELSMKEDEMVVWEEKLQQIHDDNVAKLRLAKTIASSAKWRQQPEGARRAEALGLIAEGDEESSDEEDGPSRPVCLDASQPDAAGGVSSIVDSTVLDSEALAQIGAIESVNALADIVAGEVGLLRKQWQELLAGSAAIDSKSMEKLKQSTQEPLLQHAEVAAGPTVQVEGTRAPRAPVASPLPPSPLPPSPPTLSDQSVVSTVTRSVSRFAPSAPSVVQSPQQVGTSPDAVSGPWRRVYPSVVGGGQTVGIVGAGRSVSDTVSVSAPRSMAPEPTTAQSRPALRPRAQAVPVHVASGYPSSSSAASLPNAPAPARPAIVHRKGSVPAPEDLRERRIVATPSTGCVSPGPEVTRPRRSGLELGASRK